MAAQALSIESCVGVEENDLNSFEVYPTQVANEINIRGGFKNELRVMDMSWKVGKIDF
ncbi:MAG: hypothetical protein R2809_09675 [Flavobacteriales bacterium]